MVCRAGAAEPPAKLVFQMDLGVKNVQFAGLLVAERDGFYRAAGLDVEIRRMGKGQSDYANIAATVAATEGMVGSIESGLFLAGRASGLPIVALGAMFQETPLGLMSRRAIGIRTPQDLVGTRVAVHGDGHEALDAVLQRAGLNRTQLTVTEADYGNAPLLAGKYDAKQGYLVDELIQLQVEGHDMVALPFGANGYAAYSQAILSLRRPCGSIGRRWCGLSRRATGAGGRRWPMCRVRRSLSWPNTSRNSRWSIKPVRSPRSGRCSPPRVRSWA